MASNKGYDAGLKLIDTSPRNVKSFRVFMHQCCVGLQFRSELSLETRVCLRNRLARQVNPRGSLPSHCFVAILTSIGNTERHHIW